MYKVLFVFFVALALIGHSAESVDAIIHKARRIDDEEELFEYLSYKIAELDSETLEKNPELPFRRSLVAFEEKVFVNRVGGIKQDVAQDVYDGFAFALKHADPTSLLHDAALYYEGLMQIVLQKGHLGMSAVLTSIEEYNESFLKKWSPDQTLSGEALRKAIFAEWWTSSSEMDALRRLILISSGEVDPMLGYAQCSEISVVAVEEEALICAVEYRVNQNLTRRRTFFL